jgi:hypothetical protein
MIKNWHTLPLPTRVVIKFNKPDGTVDYVRHAAIAYTIGDNDQLTYMSVYGTTYTKTDREWAFVEILHEGTWQS